MICPIFIGAFIGFCLGNMFQIYIRDFYKNGHRWKQVGVWDDVSYSTHPLMQCVITGKLWYKNKESE